MSDFFTCAGCGGKFLSPVSDEEAAAEYERDHGCRPDPAKTVLVCDDCYYRLRAIQAQQRKLQ